ncbi:MAG: ATP-grasp fold amidoligase family protein [Pseudomonadota bacterium]
MQTTNSRPSTAPFDAPAQYKERIELVEVIARLEIMQGNGDTDLLRALDKPNSLMFSDRLARRRSLWWSSPEQRPSAVQRGQKMAMIHGLMSAAATDASWRRGSHWQRRLLNKLNAREFARRLNIPCPQLYWQRRYVSRGALEELPGDFVLKPALGKRGRGVYVMAGDTELMQGKPMTHAALLTEIALSRGRFSPTPLLAEERVLDETLPNALPAEYRFYMFADTVGAIEVIERAGRVAGPTRRRFYRDDWTPCPHDMHEKCTAEAWMEPPGCLQEMIKCAQRLSLAFETFVRVDLYASARGCLFGELSSMPHGGRRFTEEADALFDALWQDHFPGAV